MQSNSTKRSAPFRIIKRGKDIAVDRRQPVLDAMNYLLSTNWSFDYTHWTLEGHHPFTDHHGVVLFENGDRIDAFCVYRRLVINGIASIYFESAVTDRSKAVRGVLKVLLGDVLHQEFGDQSPDQKIYLSWRTRSPIVYAHGSPVCDFITPAIGQSKREDEELKPVGKHIAELLFPGQEIRLETMVMPGAYSRQSYHIEPKVRLAPEINKWFAENLPDTGDAVLCVGWSKNRWSAQLSKREWPGEDNRVGSEALVVR